VTGGGEGKGEVREERERLRERRKEGGEGEGGSRKERERKGRKRSDGLIDLNAVPVPPLPSYFDMKIPLHQIDIDTMESGVTPPQLFFDSLSDCPIWLLLLYVFMNICVLHIDMFIHM
jgi:hypothetical protein